MGRRDTTAEPMDAQVQARYVRNLLRLITWTHHVKGTVDLVLSSAAQAAFGSFHAEIEARLGEGSDLGDEELKAWGSKLPGRVLKIAAHLHLMAHLAAVPDDVDLVGFGERLPLEIERPTMEGAIRVARYLIPHAVAAFETMLGGQALADANRITAWARRKTLVTFSRRDARRAFPRSIQRSAECDWRLDQALRLLLNSGRIMEKEPSPAEAGQTRTGRPHSTEYIVLEDT
jgi:hypothetical protein